MFSVEDLLIVATLVALFAGMGAFVLLHVWRKLLAVRGRNIVAKVATERLNTRIKQFTQPPAPMTQRATYTYPDRSHTL